MPSVRKDTTVAKWVSEMNINEISETYSETERFIATAVLVALKHIFHYSRYDFRIFKIVSITLTAFVAGMFLIGVIWKYHRKCRRAQPDLNEGFRLMLDQMSS